MSVKAKIVAGAATLTIVGGGLGMVGTMTASAATPNCGNSCTNIFSQKYGPQYLVDVFQAKSAANTPVILFQASNSDPAEDFVVVDEGTVNNFYRHYGLVSAAFAKTYRADEAYEVQYEPYGLNSNYCLSTWPGETPQAGYLVRLESCGAYSNSLWAADTDANTAPNGSSVVTDRRSTGGVFSPHRHRRGADQRGDQQLLQPAGAQLPGRQPDRHAAAAAERPAGEAVRRWHHVRQPGVGHHRRRRTLVTPHDWRL